MAGSSGGGGGGGFCGPEAAASDPLDGFIQSGDQAGLGGTGQAVGGLQWAATACSCCLTCGCAGRPQNQGRTERAGSRWLHSAVLSKTRLIATALPALGWLGLRAVASGVGDHFESQFRQCCQLLSVNFDLHATRNMRLFACG